MKYIEFKKEDNTTTDTAYMDGYWFGDRLMEGVSFGIKCKDGKLEGFIPKTSKAYMDDFNIPKWVKLAEAYAKDKDIFYEKENLSGQELVLITNTPKPPKQIKPYRN